MVAGLRRRVPEPVFSGTIVEDRLPPALVAAASQVELAGQSVQSLKLRDQEWQNEAWRHYDICGGLRFVSNRHAASMSRCRIYVADVGDDGKPGKETKNKQAGALLDGLFGGVAAWAEAVRQIAIQLYIAGECYSVAVAGGNQDGTDEWFVVSQKELRKWDGGIQVQRPSDASAGWYTLRKGKDLLIRIWTPHPRLSRVADSPVRAAIPTLRKIERLNQLMFSQIDSRLISAGILLFREGIDFPQAGIGKTAGVQGLMEMILDAARLQLTGAGTAAGLVPIMGTVPSGDNRYADVQQSFAHVKFDTPVQENLEKLLDQAIRQMAVELDVAPEDLLGQGDANHWSGWQIEESSIKMYIEPPLVRICAAFTQMFFAPAAKAAKLDPTKFCLWYDTAPLVVRPNRFEDALQLWDRGVIDDEALIAAGNFDATDKPDLKLQLKWMAWQAVKLNPALLAAPSIAELLGFAPEQIAGLVPPTPAPPMPPPGQETDQFGGELPPGELPPDAGSMGELPEMPEQQTSPAQRGRKRLPAVTASGFAMVPAAEQVVLRALELAGGRLLDRTNRGQYAEVARHDLHTRIQPRDAEHVERLLADAFTHVPAFATHYGVDGADLTDLLHGYCRELLLRGYAHSPDLLATVLARAGLR